MADNFKPIVGSKKILNNNKKIKYITTYTCPMCGEFLRRPAQGFLLYEKEVIKTCPYCETEIDWTKQKEELIEYKRKKEEQYKREQEENEEE